MYTVDLIRHAESKWVEEADRSPVPLFGGRMNDVDLTGLGGEQAFSFGVFAQLNGIRPTAVITSPARRARRTHELSAQGMGLEIEAIEDPRLQELDWGEWERQPRSVAGDLEVKAQRERLGLAFAPPGGESYDMVRERALAAIHERVPQLESPGHVLIYTHRNVIKALVQPFMGWTAATISEVTLDVVSLTRFTYEGGRLELALFNRATI